MDSGFELREKHFVMLGFPAGRRKHLRRWSSCYFFGFFSALILASDSPTSTHFLPDFPHSECSPTTIQHFLSSLWSAKLPITYSWKYLARITSGLQSGLESIHTSSFKFHYCGFITFLFCSCGQTFTVLIFGVILWSPRPLTLPRIQGHKGSCSHL